MSASPPSTPSEPTDPQAPQAICEFCGATNPVDSRYCIECGEGLRPYELVQMPATRRVVGDDGTTTEIVTERTFSGNLWLALLALLLIAGAIAAFVIAGNDDEGTSANPTTAQTSGTAGTETVPTDTTATETVPTDTTATTPTDTGTTPTAETWPAGTSAWAVIMKSVPEAQGEQAAQDFAAAHSDVGNVGVLNSSEFSSLRSGWWVVYTGPLPSQAAAQSKAAELRNSGIPDAYPRQVSP